MFALYLFTTIVGWAFVVLFVVFGADADGGADVDLDPDPGPVGTAGLGGLVGALLSFRTLVFFAAFFGVTGLVLRGLGVNGAATAVIAVAMGLFTAYLNTRLTAFLKRSGLTSELLDRHIAGHPARVTVPISPDRKGKVAVEVDGQPMTLVAVPYDEARQAAFAVGEPVVIVEVDGGTARVAHLDGLEGGGHSW